MNPHYRKGVEDGATWAAGICVALVALWALWRTKR